MTDPVLSISCCRQLRTAVFSVCVYDALKILTRDSGNFITCDFNIIKTRLKHGTMKKIMKVMSTIEKKEHVRDQMLKRLYHPNHSMKCFNRIVNSIVKEIRTWPECTPCSLQPVFSNQIWEQFYNE